MTQGEDDSTSHTRDKRALEAAEHIVTAAVSTPIQSLAQWRRTRDYAGIHARFAAETPAASLIEATGPSPGNPLL
jgi:hypothetical protein